MANNNGFITLDRKILDWEWYGDINTKCLFIHLLLTVNHEDKKWHGIEIKRGQRIASYATLASELCLSLRSIRTALKHLKSTGEVASESTNRYTLITVENYDLYQSKKKRATNKTASNKASKGQARDKQGATNNNDNNNNNDNKDIYSRVTHDVISYLNEKTGYHYRATTGKTQRLIRARMNEHFTENDFKTVIDNMTGEWLSDRKMQKYLRPETLFGTKFESYLNRIPAKPKDDYDYGEVL